MRTFPSGSVSVLRSDVVFASVLRSLPPPLGRALHDAELADAVTLRDYPRADPVQLEGFLAEYAGDMLREEKGETEVTGTMAMGYLVFLVAYIPILMYSCPSEFCRWCDPPAGDESTCQCSLSVKIQATAFHYHACHCCDDSSASVCEHGKDSASSLRGSSTRGRALAAEALEAANSTNPFAPRRNTLVLFASRHATGT